MYSRLSSKKRKQQGYEPVTEIIPAQSVVEHGFDVSPTGRCPKEIMDLLQALEGL